jgi:hypothetical protein
MSALSDKPEVGIGQLDWTLSNDALMIVMRSADLCEGLSPINQLLT